MHGVHIIRSGWVQPWHDQRIMSPVFRLMPSGLARQARHLFFLVIYDPPYNGTP
jgi:hypothetical protein